MNKLYVFVCCALSLFAQAQSPFEVKDLEVTPSATFAANTIFNLSTTANTIGVHHDFQITNISANPIVVTVRKYETLLNTVSMSDKAAAYFCFDGACYTPDKISATISIGAGASFSFIPKLDEATQVGLSEIGYNVSVNGANNFSLTLKYNAPASVKENSNYFSAASNIYPNPAAAKAFFEVSVPNDLQGAGVKVFNSLGSAVIAKNINLAKGKNNIALDTENLPDGIYFVNLAYGQSSVTKRMIINK
jgi:hypothetical protein